LFLYITCYTHSTSTDIVYLI